LRTGPKQFRVRRAFTTIELILAIVIGLIVSVLGFSGFRVFSQELPVKSATRRMNHVFATARSFAIARNGYFQVTLDLDRKNFWIDEINNPTIDPPSILTRNQKIVSPEKIDDRVAIEGVRYVFLAVAPFTTGIQHFIFRPDGSANLDARITFHEVAKDPAIDSNIHTLRLYGGTGLTKVFPRERR
jgi:Tfp pilus assembly protein FimT